MFSVAHISDLHLGETPGDVGNQEKASAAGVWKAKRLTMQSHDGFILATLRNELKRAAHAVGVVQGEFDVVIASGDISTNASSDERFDFARAYLTSSIKLPDGAEAGLHLDHDRLLCVPGNHDKLFERSPKRYLRRFGDLPANPPYAKVIVRNEACYLFLGIDSNDYSEGNIGLGTISPGSLGWLSEQLAEPAHQDRFHLITLVLHHHPADLNGFARRSIAEAVKGRFTTLSEGDRLLDVCRGKVDLILHGHEHFPIAFIEPRTKCLIVSAGTTMEWQPSRGVNSFHALTCEENTLRVAQFSWNGANFEVAAGYSFRREQSRIWKTA